MLTDAKVRKAKPQDKPYKLADSGGLYVQVSKTGNRAWRFKYRFGGKEKLLTIGTYPQIGLKHAREARDDAKKLLAEGRDPSLEKKKGRADTQAAADNSFEKVAREWHAMEQGRWKAVHAADVINSLERDIFPKIGSYGLRDLDPAIVLKVLRPIEERGAIETAKRIRQRMSAVFVYGIASGLCEQDPAAIVTRALKPIIKKGRQPALVELEELREMIRRVESEFSSPVTRLAHRLLALTAVRIGTLRGARWDEFIGLGGKAPVWHIPAARMKLPKHQTDDPLRDHIVPLVPQAVKTIEAVRTLTGRTPLLFPNQRYSHKPMSENAIGYLLNRAGYHGRHVPHGWRAAFSTIMNERAVSAGRHSDRYIIDAMLAHVPKDKVEAAYNRAEHRERRREIAQEWADIILEDMPPARAMLGTRRK